MRLFNYFLFCTFTLFCFGLGFTTPTLAQSETPSDKPEATTPPASSTITPTPQKAPTVTIPANTVLRLMLVTQVSTKINQVDDPVTAELDEPYRVDGKLVFGRGTEFRGKVAQIIPAKFGQRQASLKIVFEQVVTDYGAEPITTLVTNVEDFSTESRLKADKDGVLQGGHSGSRTVTNTIRGGVLGSLGGTGIIWGGGGGGAAAGTIGGGAATGILLTKGNDIHLHRGALIRIKFTQPVTFTL